MPTLEEMPTVATALEAVASSVPKPRRERNHVAKEMKRIDQKATAKLNSKRGKGVKPEAKTPAVAKKAAKPINADAARFVSEIRQACLALKLDAAIVRNKPAFAVSQTVNFVLRLPTWKEFKATLPQDGSALPEVKLFHKLREMTERLTGDATQTYLCRPSGKFTLWSEFSGK